MSKLKRPDPSKILEGLKDFQRETVEYVFRRMYLDSNPANRFLVADEVGLGKTMIARGVIAKAVDIFGTTIDASILFMSAQTLTLLARMSVR